MESFKINSTEISPRVTLDLQSNTFLIEGKSVVVEATEFYTPVLLWLKEAKEEASSAIDFVVNLKYFDVSSSKMLLDIFYELSNWRAQGIPVNILWHFSMEDSDMREVGEDFACMVDLPFKFVSKDLVTQLA